MSDEEIHLRKIRSPARRHLQYGDTEIAGIIDKLCDLGIPPTEIAAALSIDYVTLWRKRTRRSGWSRPELAVVRAMFRQAVEAAEEREAAIRATASNVTSVDR